MMGGPPLNGTQTDAGSVARSAGRFRRVRQIRLRQTEAAEYAADNGEPNVDLSWQSIIGEHNGQHEQAVW